MSDDLTTWLMKLKEHEIEFEHGYDPINHQDILRFLNYTMRFNASGNLIQTIRDATITEPPDLGPIDA